MPIYKSVLAEFNARYIEDNNGSQLIQNCFGFSYNLDNIINYKYYNSFLSEKEIYAASQQNFLFLATSLDVELIINGLNIFAVKEFILVQKSYIFNFEIRPLMLDSSCQTSIQVFHGKLKLENDQKEEYYGKYNSTT